VFEPGIPHLPEVPPVCEHCCAPVDLVGVTFGSGEETPSGCAGQESVPRKTAKSKPSVNIRCPPVIRVPFFAVRGWRRSRTLSTGPDLRPLLQRPKAVTFEAAGVTAASPTVSLVESVRHGLRNHPAVSRTCRRHIRRFATRSTSATSSAARTLWSTRQRAAHFSGCGASHRIPGPRPPAAELARESSRALP